MSNAEVIGPDGAIRRQGDSLAPQGVIFAAYILTNPTVAQGVPLPYNTELFDPYGWFDSVTNYRFQPQIAGYYRVSFSVRDSAPPAGGWSRAQLWKNGAVALTDGAFQNASPGESIGTTIAYLNGSTDYLDVRRYRSDANSGQLTATSPEHSHFSAELVGSSVGVIPEPWHLVGATGEPAFQNGWTNYDVSTFSPTAFFKDPSGIVHLRGLVKAGTVGDNVAIFTLPAGYRPIKEMHFATASNGAFAYSHVIPSGVVDAAVGNNTWFSLDNIHFRAEQ